MAQRPVPGEARRRVLVVDDDPDVRDILRKVLEAAGGYSVWEAGRAEGALGHLSAADLLVTDISMPGMGGLALIRRARREHPDLLILAVSGEPSNGPEALDAGADRFLAKPVRIAELQEAADFLLENRGSCG
ncbi:MAG: response regulator [Deferrisomatales bacterium]|nr:response regulator [Deferrisomatales bacterium]